MYIESKVHSQDFGFWSKHLLTLLLFLQETPQALSIFPPLTFWLLNIIDYPSESINWIVPFLPLPPIPCWWMKRKIIKGRTKIFNSRIRFNRSRIEERNLIVPLLTHVFSIDCWFSSIFIITISGSIPPSRTVIPFVCYPFPVHFLPPAHLLATLTLLHVRNDSTGGQRRFGRRKKWNGKLSRFLCVKLKHLVRRDPNSLSARVRHLRNIGVWIFLLFLSWLFLLTKH